MLNRPVAVLLNPPSHDIAIRDNYCSKISQAAYINHPIDLLFQSGYLDKHFHLVLIDSVVDNLSFSETLDHISSFDPYVVYSLAGNATWPDDLAFFRALRKALPNMKLACSGDIFLESPDHILKTVPEIDAILTDFTSDGLLRWLLSDHPPYTGLVFRINETGIEDHREPPQNSGVMTPPLPRHDIFLNHDYRYPFVKNRRFATVMTEFGCPFHCSFCVMGTLGCKRRPIDDVMTELDSLEQLGIRDIFFLDQSFGSDPNRNRDLCQGIRTAFPELRWLCFSRVDLVDEMILRSMKDAGCHTIIFGVETADEALLHRYRKGYTTADVRRVLDIAGKLGIRTVATFLLGLPGETWDSAMRTIAFAQKLPCTYASLNVAVPRMGTDLRREAVAAGYVDPGMRHFDQSGTEVVIQTETLSTDQLRKLKQIAVRRLYFDPRRWFRILMSIRSRDEFLIQFREGCRLLGRYIGM